MFYDGTAERDNTTAHAMLEGLGLPGSLATSTPEIFHPQKANKLCPYLTAKEWQDAIKAQLASIPPPSDLAQLLLELQTVLGRGTAPPIPDIEDIVSADGFWLGGIYVASAWAEVMLLQQGAGLPVGYGRVPRKKLYRLLKLHTYYRQIDDWNFVLAQRGQSNILAHMLDDLALPAEGAPTTAAGGGGQKAALYVGHDAQLDGLGSLLNLSWAAPPFPRNATPPGSMLRITRTGGTGSAEVTIDFLYTTFESTAGDMHAENASFAAGRRSMPLDEFNARVGGSIMWDCVRKNATYHTRI